MSVGRQTIIIRLVIKLTNSFNLFILKIYLSHHIGTIICTIIFVQILSDYKLSM